MLRQGGAGASMPDELLDAIFVNIRSSSDLKKLALVCRRFNRLVQHRLWKVVRIDLDKLAALAVFSPLSYAEITDDTDGASRKKDIAGALIPKQATIASRVNISINHAKNMADRFNMAAFLSCFPQMNMLSFDFADLRLCAPPELNIRSVAIRLMWGRNGWCLPGSRAVLSFPNIRNLHISAVQNNSGWTKLEQQMRQSGALLKLKSITFVGSALLNASIFEDSVDLTFLRLESCYIESGFFYTNHHNLQYLAVVQPLSQRHNCIANSVHMRQWTFRSFVSLKTLVIPEDPFLVYCRLLDILPPQLEILQLQSLQSISASQLSSQQFRTREPKLRQLIADKSLGSLSQLKDVIFWYHVEQMQMRRKEEIVDVRDLVDESQRAGMNFIWTNALFFEETPAGWGFDI